MGLQDDAPCKGCRASVRVSEEQIAALVDEVARREGKALAPEAVVAARLARCRACPDLLYGTTCRHCGCLVAVRAALAEKGCPRPSGPRW